MPKAAAVIVTFNRKEKLRRCIEAVLDQTSAVRPDIFVVDNNSSDGTGEMIAELAFQYPGRIMYNDLRYNSGGAGGFCYGMRKALEAGYDYLWLMDDDCVPAKDALEEFLRFDSSHAGSYGFLSGRALWRDGSPHRMNIQRETVFRSIPAGRLAAMDRPCRIEMASFVSLFLPAGIVREVGLPLREFYIWTDDWEYTRRISRRYPCWLLPSSEVMHDTGSNEGADIASADADRIRRFRYLYRNDVYLYRREGIRGAAYEAARLALHTLRIAAGRGSIGEKKRRMGIMLRSTAEGLSFRPVPDRAAVTDKGNGR